MPITISNTTPRVVYTASAAQTLFSVPYEFFDPTDLAVYKDDVIMTYSATPSGVSQYSVTGAGVSGGGSISFGSGLAGGEIVLIISTAEIKRQTDLPLSGALPIDTLNEQFDRSISLMLGLEADLKRSLRLSAFDQPYISMDELPAKSVRAGKVLGFDSDGQPEASITTSSLTGLSSLELFTDLWLTPKASDPATDDDGDALLDGASYYNTVTNVWRSYNAGSGVWEAMTVIASDAGSVTYEQAGTGASSTNVQERLRREIWAEDFGADPTGVADSTTAIQAAIDHAESLYSINPPSGACVRLGAGQFKVSAALVIQRRYIAIRGCGAQITNVFTQTDTHDVFVFDGTADPGGFALGNEIRDLAVTWEGAGDRTGGIFIHMNNIREPVVFNCNLENPHRGMLFTSCNRSRVIANHIDGTARAQNVTSYGMRFEGLSTGNKGQSHVIGNEIRGGNPNFGLHDCIQVGGQDGLYIHLNHLQGGLNAIAFRPDGTANNDFVDGISITGCYFDATLNNDILFLGTASHYKNILIANCYSRAAGVTGSSGGYGINIIPDVGTTISRLHITGCEFHIAFRTGIYCQTNRIEDCKISDCLFSDGDFSDTAHGDIILDGDGWSVTNTTHVGGDNTNANAFAIKLEPTLVNAVLDGVNMLKSTYQNSIIDNTTGGGIFIRNIHKRTSYSVIEFEAELQTVNDTTATLFAYVPADDESGNIDAVVMYTRDNWLNTGSYRVHSAFRRQGGAGPVIVGSGTVDPEIGGEDSAGANARVLSDGVDEVRIRVTGIASADFEWYVRGTITRRR